MNGMPVSPVAIMNVFEIIRLLHFSKKEIPFAKKRHTRQCLNLSNTTSSEMKQKYCSGDSEEFDDCDLKSLPVCSAWTQWQDWSFCDRSCDGGIRIRNRDCICDTTCTGISQEV